MSFHRFHRAEEKEFGESGEMASWGNWYFTTSHDENVSRVLLQILPVAFLTMLCS